MAAGKGPDKRQGQNESDDTYEEISINDVMDLDDDLDDTMVVEDETGASFEVISLVNSQVEDEDDEPTERNGAAPRAGRMTRVTDLNKLEADTQEKQPEEPQRSPLLRFVEQEYKVHGVASTFFGRKDELKSLYTAIKETVNDQRLRIVAIGGAQGMGKSRLVNEFFQLIDLMQRNITVLYSWCKERNETGNFSLFRRLLQQRFEIGPNESNQRAYDKLTLGLVDLIDGKRLQETAQLLGYLLELRTPLEASRPDYSNVNLLHTRALSAFANLLRKDAANQPVILLLDSMQWAQADTLVNLSLLIKQLTNERILLIYLSRDGLPDILQRAGIPVTTVESKALPDNDVEKLCRNLLRNVSELPQEMVDLLVRQSGGNPQLLEELIRIHVKHGAITPSEEEPWSVNPAAIRVEALPTTLQASAELRINHLGERERAIIEKASVFGNTFWFGGLLSIMRLDREASDSSVWSDDRKKLRLNQVMMQMQADDIALYRSSSSIKHEIEFNFVQPLEQQHLYQQLDQELRAKYHRMVSQWLERNKDNYQGTIFDMLALHHERGGNRRKAGYYYQLAANRLKTRYHNDKAIQMYRRSLELLEEDDAELICEILLNLGGVYTLVGSFDQALDAYEQMVYYSSIIVSKQWAGKAYLGMGQTLRTKGDYPGAIDKFHLAFKLFQDVNDTQGIADAMDGIGRNHWYQGDYGSYKEALGYYLKSLSLRRKNKDHGAIALSLVNIGNIHLSRGYVKDAEECFLESLEIRKHLGDLRAISVSLNGLGAVYHEQGNAARAVEVWEEAIKIAEEIGDRGMSAILLNNLGETNLAAENIGAAVAYLNEAVEIAEEIDDRRTLADIYRNLANVFVTMDEPIKAREICEKALGIAEEIRSNLAIGQSLKTLAEIFALTLYHHGDGEGNDKRASECFQKSMNYLEEMGDELEYAKVLKSYGHFLIERGVSNKGRKLLKKSEAILARLSE